ncbi:hypothetical protein PGTUg99_004022 [Puccinia graminis f. sp. tritici]|uniref:Uncharacterized protein n=1 Tax=Puccinia graminis f. sp. tritici TaxID=56615 RepID=A0A5B0M6Z8_PUCGR|nr:hypothetical protein PGTUg99_004022 [Puccinia graminis f. sp. tritici]
MFDKQQRSSFSLGEWNLDGGDFVHRPGLTFSRSTARPFPIGGQTTSLLLSLPIETTGHYSPRDSITELIATNWLRTLRLSLPNILDFPRLAILNPAALNSHRPHLLSQLLRSRVRRRTPTKNRCFWRPIGLWCLPSRVRRQTPTINRRSSEPIGLLSLTSS